MGGYRLCWTSRLVFYIGWVCLEGNTAGMGVFFVWGVVFVCVEGVDFDGRMVFLEWKWWFSCGAQHVLEFGRVDPES